MLLEFIVGMLLAVVISVQTQERWRIPTPVTLVGVSMIVSAWVAWSDVSSLGLNTNVYAQAVLMMFPMLIASDALKMDLVDFQRHGLGLFLVAILGVMTSVGMGVLGGVLLDWNVNGKPILMVEWMMLFAILCATDPVAVGAIMNNFKLPHELKFLAEGESLLNDAAALIMFELARELFLKQYGWGDHKEVTILSLGLIVTLIGAVMVGAIVGTLMTKIIEQTQDLGAKAWVIVAGAYISYALADHWGCSGIVSSIFCVLWVKPRMRLGMKLVLKWIKRRRAKWFFRKNKIMESDANYLLKSEQKKMRGWMDLVKWSEEQNEIGKYLGFGSIAMNGALFLGLGVMMDWRLIQQYAGDIGIVLILSTAIRGIMMMKFAWISNRVNHMHNIRWNWWAVLTLSGSKGAFALVMVSLIPESVPHKQWIETVVIGVVISSLMLYSALLAGFLKWKKEDFERECRSQEIDDYR